MVGCSAWLRALVHPFGFIQSRSAALPGSSRHATECMPLESGLSEERLPHDSPASALASCGKSSTSRTCPLHCEPTGPTFPLRGLLAGPTFPL
eukprot:365830-Chlamydomonas_euryale.AAC.5